ncbi:DNA polymerase III subunit beta [Kitasatospora sp. MBT63]|uniref:DNA polymerase III subunit beta n=1 Tax=Kitasatospora sp. MBT63 TaxID=1444768 RepID=UPI00053A00BA|nr:DNA polymerase III subunit beta [Kitasatospora sp. MBT63]
MKLRLFAGPLADAVAHVARALPARPPVPVLAGILLATGEKGMTLSAFDYEVAAATSTGAEIADDGTVLVSGRLLNEIAKTLPKGGEVDIELSGARLLLVCGSARFTLPTLPVEEYPALPPVPDTMLTVDADALAAAVAQVAVAASTDASLPVLTGVQMVLEGDRLTLAGTDRYRFGVRELTVKPTGTLPTGKPKRGKKKDTDTEPDTAGEVRRAACTVLVPAKFLSDATRAMAGEHPIGLGWNDGQLTLTTPGSFYGTRLLEGEFPKFRGLFPKPEDARLTLTVAVDDALAALKRVSLVASAKTPVRLAVTADGEELLLEAGHSDDAHAVDRIPCNTDGALEDGAAIAFNPGYLADALKALAAPEATFHVTHHHKPVVLIGRAGDLAESDYEHLLMPIRQDG